MVSEMLLVGLTRTLIYPKLRERIAPEKAAAFTSWIRDHGTLAEEPASTTLLVPRPRRRLPARPRDRQPRVPRRRRSGPTRPQQRSHDPHAHGMPDQAPGAILSSHHANPAGSRSAPLKAIMAVRTVPGTGGIVRHHDAPPAGGLQKGVTRPQDQPLLDQELSPAVFRASARPVERSTCR